MWLIPKYCFAIMSMQVELQLSWDNICSSMRKKPYNGVKWKQETSSLSSVRMTARYFITLLQRARISNNGYRSSWESSYTATQAGIPTISDLFNVETAKNVVRARQSKIDVHCAHIDDFLGVLEGVKIKLFHVSRSSIQGGALGCYMSWPGRESTLDCNFVQRLVHAEAAAR